MKTINTKKKWKKTPTGFSHKLSYFEPNMVEVTQFKNKEKQLILMKIYTYLNRNECSV